jgi:hypothetical protein
MSERRVLILRLALCFAVLCAGSMIVFAINQETPVGSLMGKIVATGTGTPLPAEVRLSAEGGKAWHYTTADSDGTFRFTHLPAGTYTVYAGTETHTMEPVTIGIFEGQVQHLDLPHKPREPSIDIWLHQQIFLPSEKPRITIHGFTPVKSIDIRLYRVDPDALLVKYGGSLENLIWKNVGADVKRYEAHYKDAVDLSKNPCLTLAYSVSEPITKRDFEGGFVQRINLPATEPGTYIISAKADRVQDFNWLMVTSLGMVTKSAGRQLLAYTVDLKTGAPRADSEVTVCVNGKVVASGRTNAEGLAELRLPRAAKHDEVESDHAEGDDEVDSEDVGDTANGDAENIVARNGTSFAFASNEISTIENVKNVIYTYTERPVYKPGQTVFFKGIVRRKDTGKYSVPSSLPIVVEIRDSKDTLVYRETSRTDEFGAFAGSLSLNSECLTGTYTIMTFIQGQGRGRETDFRVAAYRKPEYSVKVEFAQHHYIRGDVARAVVSANYYFGAPLTSTSLHYIVRRTPYWFFEDEEDDFAARNGYHDYGDYGEQVAEGDVRTDSDGKASIDFPATWEQPKERNAWDSDQRFIIEVSATDKSNQEVTGSASVPVTRGEFALDTTLDRYVVDGDEPVTLSIHAAAFDKHPIAGQNITVTVGEEKWKDDKLNFLAFKEQTLKTSGAGDASLTFSIGDRPGAHVAIKTTDSRGNIISAQCFVYSGKYDFEEGDSHVSDLQLVADKKVYKAGDTAKVLVRVAKPGADVLVTTECDGVYDRRVVHISRRSALVRIPVKNEYKPNFFIAACYVRNKEFFNQEVHARVAMGEQALKIKVTPNKSKYRPGENAVYRIKVLDGKGRPAVAQLSVGIVDEAIYAIEEETTTPILDYFYARRWNSVNTTFSFPQIYLSDPDKAGTAALTVDPRRVRVRKKFLDTAFWNPLVTTDSNGSATVRFKMPDNLTTWRTTVRAVTLDTACGEATSTVIATQDFMVRLETPRFLVQSDRATIIAIVHNYTGRSQNVTVDLVAPSLHVRGSVSRRLMVKNNTDERVTWEVEASKLGAADITARAVTGRYGDAMQLTLPVEPHGVKRESTSVGYLNKDNADNRTSLIVGSDSVPGAVSMRVKLASSLSSSLLGSLQYLAEYPWGCTEQTTSAFLPDVVLSHSMKELGIHDQALESKLPDMVTKGLLRLYRFQLDDGGWSWCEYGKSDPWMTAYVCYALLRARDAGFAVNKQALEKGITRLEAQFRENNLKSLDPYDSEDPYNNFYDTRAYAAYVLSIAGIDIAGNVRLDTGYDLPAKSGIKTESSPIMHDGLRITNPLRHIPADSRTLALVTLTYANLGKTEQAQEELGKLFQHAQTGGGETYWATSRGYWDPDDVETTALALAAVLKLDPHDQRAFPISRWLMDRRRGDRWYSTRDTAMALYALADFLKISKEMSPDYEAEALVNGKSIAKRHFGKDSTVEPQFEIEVPTSILHTGQNTLEIKKEGPGVLYYTADLTQYSQSELKSPRIPSPPEGEGKGEGENHANLHSTMPSQPGLSIQREYFRPPKSYYENTWKRDPGASVHNAGVGDVVLVKLTVHASKVFHHVLLEDFMPAGCEIVDRGDVGFEYWYDWWCGQDVRDDRIAFYLDEIDRGDHLIQYQMRASFPGDYHALPAQAFEMYQPEVGAATTETEFQVR